MLTFISAIRYRLIQVREVEWQRRPAIRWVAIAKVGLRTDTRKVCRWNSDDSARI